jgi:hypothetical protein
MAELKTKKNSASVLDFIQQVDHEKRKSDALRLLEIFTQETGESAVMWGDSIIGFGSYHYIYESGREGDWPMVGFSPRKQNLTLYIMTGFARATEILSKIGKYKTGKSCFYINKLEDVDESLLRQLIKNSFELMKSKYQPE